MAEKVKAGTILWHDLTVSDAANVREFYEKVVGWQSESVDVGDYADFNMKQPGGDEPVTGICHARGINADIPPQWMIYVVVDDLDASLAACEANGGSVITPVRDHETSRLAMIQDPAGAYMALYEFGE